jgi:methionine aminopeptidase
VALGRTLTQPGTIRFLGVAVSVAGTTANSGVFTVLKNGSTTTITCTVGTNTSCSDSSHFITVSDGDIISVQFTTQAAETLAGAKAYVLIY